MKTTPILLRERRDTQCNPGSSRKKIKLAHSECHSPNTKFDLSSIGVALDFGSDQDSNYRKEIRNEIENVDPEDVNLSSAAFRKKLDQCDEFNEIEKVITNISPIQNTSLKESLKEEKEYNDYISDVRARVNYLNTMEDDEEQTYTVRAKLFEHVIGYDDYFAHFNGHLFPSNVLDGPARWTERGIGQVKFLRHLEEGITYGTVRITMYHEGTLKLLMNHLVEPGLEVTSTKDKRGRRHYMWSTEDLAVVGKQVRTFALRFVAERDALSWKDHFEKSKKATGDARMAYDPTCYAPPGSPLRNE